MAKRQRKRKPGRLSELEIRTAQTLLAVNPDLSDAAIAKALNRRKSAITTHLHDARLTLAEHAPYFADLLIKGAAIAASKGRTEPAQWALERIRELGPDGKAVVRVIDPLEVVRAGNDHDAGALTVNVGISISQVEPTSSSPSALPEIEVSTYPSLPAEVIGVSLNPEDSDS